MLFSTTEQVVMLSTAVLGGLLIGYAMAPNPRKWKRRLRQQSESFTKYCRDAEDRLRAANQRATDLNAEVAALRADHAEAERTIAALRPAVAAGRLAASDTAGFATSTRDDLTRMHGIDSVLNTRLFGLGVTRFQEIERLSAEDEMALEQRLALPVGYVTRARWRTQAALLRNGRVDDHEALFGASKPVPAR